MTDRQSIWQQINSLSCQMLEQAKAGQWQDVISMESERQSMMQSFFDIKPALDEADWIATGIQSVMAIDQQIVVLGKQGMEGLSQELKQVRKAAQAQNAYQEARL